MRPTIGLPQFFPLQRVFSTKIILSSLVAALSIAPAIADDAADVSKLLRAGQHNEALAKADAYLAQRPKDPQMRFLKGVILTEQNKSAEAIAVFAKLTEDYPNLPEPYNNLAVLYAANNQFEKARAALDKAIRTNPSYATAYENLGDVHARLASQAYDKALQLNSSNTETKSKLTMVRTLVAGTTAGANASVPATTATPATGSATKAPAPAPAASVPQQTPPVTAPAPAPATAAAPKAPVPSPSTPAPDNKPTQLAEAKKPAPAAETKPAPAVNPERDAVLAVVQQWAKAWSAKDVKGYLAFYSNDFDPPKGMSRKAWVEERHARIAGKGKIQVKVESPQVQIDGNTATVKFRQSYVSDRLTANSRKTLILAKQGGRWQIQQEQIGS